MSEVATLPFRLTANAAKRIREIAAKDPTVGGLRLAVLGGGCAGFSYEIDVAPGPAAEDLVIERDGARLFLDPIGLDLVAGSELDWVEELIGARFEVKNPNARSSCGCGVSFSV